MAIENLPPLIVLSAPSGCGKSKVTEHITNKNLAPLERVITTTTRKPRPNDGVMEIDGIDYDFVSVEEFQEKIVRGEFAEYADYGSSLYGTPWQRIEQILIRGKVPLSILETKGAANIIESVKEHMRTISIFLTLDPKIQESRLRGRGSENEDKIQQRLKDGLIERTFASRYDLRIENTDSLETAKIIADITNEMIVGRTREQICKIYDVFSGQTL